MRYCEAAVHEPDCPTRYFVNEPRFSGGKDILRNLEDTIHGQNPDHN